MRCALSLQEEMTAKRNSMTDEDITEFVRQGTEKVEKDVSCFEFAALLSLAHMLPGCLACRQIHDKWHVREQAIVEAQTRYLDDPAIQAAFYKITQLFPDMYEPSVLYWKAFALTFVQIRPQAPPPCTIEEFLSKFDGYFELTKELMTELKNEITQKGLSGHAAIMELQQKYERSTAPALVCSSPLACAGHS